MKKSIEEWEREKNCFVMGRYIKENLTEEEFDAIDVQDKVGVDWHFRLAFLEKCGYKITRENIINPNLSYRNIKT